MVVFSYLQHSSGRFCYSTDCTIRKNPGKHTRTSTTTCRDYKQISDLIERDREQLCMQVCSLWKNGRINDGISGQDSSSAGTSMYKCKYNYLHHILHRFMPHKKNAQNQRRQFNMGIKMTRITICFDLMAIYTENYCFGSIASELKLGFNKYEYIAVCTWRAAQRADI